jgi:hypothetical protein
VQIFDPNLKTGHESETFSPPHAPVSPGFVDTMRIRLIAGRDFIPSDAEPLQPTAVIVNEAFARRYFGAASPIGRVYDRTGQPPPVRQEIVGVVSDVRSDLRNLPPPTVYVPLRGFRTMQVRAAGGPLALTAVIDREIRATHPSLRATAFTLQATQIANTLVRERLLAHHGTERLSAADGFLRRGACREAGCAARSHRSAAIGVSASVLHPRSFD